MFAGMPRGASLVGSMRIASSQLRPSPYQMKYDAMLRPQPRRTLRSRTMISAAPTRFQIIS